MRPDSASSCDLHRFAAGRPDRREVHEDGETLRNGNADTEEEARLEVQCFLPLRGVEVYLCALFYPRQVFLESPSGSAVATDPEEEGI